MERYYQPEIECAPREEIVRMQNEKLVKQIRRIWDIVPYYRKKMQEKGEPNDSTNFGSHANPGIGSHFGQTKFLAIHSASQKIKG